MREVLGPEAAAFEPQNYKAVTDVVVDSRLRPIVPDLAAKGHRIIHLVRDGRDVVRSLDQWFRDHAWARNNYYESSPRSHLTTGGVLPFRELCQEWRVSVDIMQDHPAVRLEDLSSSEAKNAQAEKTLPHWTEWDEAMTATFWSICGDQMARMGYER
jgi:hypothetical protein